MQCFICQALLFPPYIKCLECLTISEEEEGEDDTYVASSSPTEVEHEDETVTLSTLTAAERHNLENITICPICFSSGKTVGFHLPSHNYEIIRDDFLLLPGSTWSAKEEVQLLDAIESCGIGNWQDVSRMMAKRTAKECEKHYSSFFMKSHNKELQVQRQTEPDDFGCEAIIRTAVNGFGLPPRPVTTSILYNELSGYTAPCSEFNDEYDDHAELIVGDINFEVTAVPDETEEDQNFFSELQLGVVDMYRYRVFQREYRKRLVRRHGLINIAATDLYFTKLLKIFPPDIVMMLRKCMRLMGGEQFLKYIEGLKVETRLRQHIRALTGYRSQGLTRLHHIRMYERLKSQRDDTLKKKQAFDQCVKNLQDEETWQNWVKHNSITEKIATGATLPVPALSRKQANPMDITGLPGYEKLDNGEVQGLLADLSETAENNLSALLCSVARLFPTAYVEYKRLFINEFRKEGFIKLQRARSLIKIDVNKTRKIFDFLIERKLISKSPLVYT